MKRARMWRMLWGASLVVALLLVSSVALAGSPHQEDPFPPDGWAGPIPPLETPDVHGPAEGEPGGVGPASVQAIEAAPSTMMNYQGLLADAGGTPLNGTYTMKFSLHTAATGGGKTWGDETHSGVVVSKGLFQVVLGSILPLTSDMFAQQLYLQTVVGTTVLPRQPLLAVPYAMGLTPGAGTYGATALESQYGFYASNEGGRGLYANAKGDGTIALFSADVTYSDEGYSGPETVVWVPGTAVELYALDSAQGHIEHYYHGLARVNSDSDNQVLEAVLPLQLEQPYGRSFHLTQVTLYYKVGAPAYIDQVFVEGRNYNTDLYPDAEVADANGTSTVYTSYEIPVDPPFAINTVQTVTDIKLLINTGTPNGADGFVDVYGVRLTLVSNY